ncbi:MAG: NAD(P)/FAD-dependent oxidoreductase [Clostridia bacterium]|nr:NAD(P)/FAD-dependent oxidoreductase [Clostridia bacterium]
MEYLDCIIVGSGPAGVSAALYTLRAGLKTLLISTGESGLKKADRIENYYGFPQGISGEMLLHSGEDQAQRLGARILQSEVTRIESFDGLRVITPQGDYFCGALLLATGAKRARPNLPGLAELEGKGVSACAVCDGFFHRGKPVAVLGSGDFAAAEARELAHVAGSVTVLTNGEQPSADFGELPVVTTPLAEVEGNEFLSGVRFSDGSRLPLSGLFVALGKASAADLARAAGILIGQQGIEVDAQMQTNIPGIFAAGDCVGGLLQISKSVGEGAVAGMAIVNFLRQKKQGKPN